MVRARLLQDHNGEACTHVRHLLCHACWHTDVCPDRSPAAHNMLLSLNT